MFSQYPRYIFMHAETVLIFLMRVRVWFEIGQIPSRSIIIIVIKNRQMYTGSKGHHQVKIFSINFMT